MKDIETLKKAYEDVIWMAIRYAHGRHTYAPSMVRESISEFQKVFPDWKPAPDATLKNEREFCKDQVSPMSVDSDWLDDLVEDNH